MRSIQGCWNVKSALPGPRRRYQPVICFIYHNQINLGGLPAGEFVVTCDDPVNMGEMITVTVQTEQVVDAGTCMVTFVDYEYYMPVIFKQ